MQQQPYNNRISNYFLLLVFISLIIAFSSCAATKRDCRGVKHYKQSGGFYLYNKPACKDCGETNCIYEQINNAVEGEGTDSEIEQAIQDVCKSRNITDENTIDLLRANYYL